ncbi:MAG: S9 family peptidase [Sedimentisphaerales bacterium]|nr:S9 family peptidase [Sedimentisphaerales bacterium]
MRHVKFLFALLIILSGCAAYAPPTSRQVPVVNEYHGVKVTDPYQWLEDWQDESVQSWSNKQNAYARAVLNNLPGLEKLRERITQILTAESVSYSSLCRRAGIIFAVKRQPPQEQPFLVVMRSAQEPESERIIIDPAKIDPSGKTSIDFYVPSPGGRLVAVSLSSGGSESGDVHIYNTQTGEETAEVIFRVNGGTAGGDVAWTPDGSGFYYTRYPRDGERPLEDMNFYQQVWFHRMGTSPDQDRYELGKDFPRIAETILESDMNSGRILATVQYGDSGRFAFYLREPAGKWTRIIDYDDGIVQAIFGDDNTLFLISRKSAPRGKLVKLSLVDYSLDNAQVVVPEGEDTIVSDFYGHPTMIAASSRLYVTCQLGGPSEIRVFDYNGRRLPGPEILPVSSVGQIVAAEDNILYQNSSYLESSAWYCFKPGENTTAKTALVSRSPVDFSDCEVIREFAVSKDGTKVPVNIIRRRGTKLYGTNPVLLTGYGGYGISRAPRHSALRRVWLDQGGVFAEANIRGGGEFGEQWHKEGMLTEKQNVFDDFSAAMQYMIDSGYCSAQKLAITGGSNGGLLMGAMITQHSDLCRAVVSFVGIYDMLRVELAPNGEFNIPEFGTVKDPEQFRALYAYSPYHNVRDGAAYPAVLFLTGANDPRVDPMHSRKMTARLQAATSSGRPVLLRTSSSTGHGLSTPLSEQIAEAVHYHAFLLHELGLKYRSPKSRED